MQKHLLRYNSGQGDAMTTDNAILLGIADENPEYE